MATFTFNGELTFHDEHKVECKPMTMIEILNNPYHFKMTISPNKQINLQKMALKQIKFATPPHLVVFLSFNLTSGVSGLPLLEHLPKSCTFF